MKAVFIDRDGTINDDPVGYISRAEDFCLFPFAAEAIRILNQLDFKVIVVSNQSGIARGYFTEEDLRKVHKYMIDELDREGANVDMVLYSPYHPEGIVEPFNIEHNSRKPGSGMFYEALKRFPIMASKSYMIGDKMSDIEFGKRNGMISILVSPLLKAPHKVEPELASVHLEGRDSLSIIHYPLSIEKPDFIVENILTAAKVIKVLERQKNG